MASFPPTTTFASSTSVEPVALKLLVNQNVAGSLIGRGGNSIQSLQQQSGARIRLSQSNDFFPGSQDRVVLILGSLMAVSTAQSLVLDRVFRDSLVSRNIPQGLLESPVGIEASLEPMLEVTAKFVIPNRTAGVLIGQGGGNIRELHTRSGAHLQLKNRHGAEGDTVALLKERVVEVSGLAKSCGKAVELSLEMLVNDDSVENPAGTLRYQNMTTSYSRILSNADSPVFGGESNSLPPQRKLHHRQNSLYRHEPSSTYPSVRNTPPTTVTIPVADKLMHVVTNGGGRLAKIQSVSGATITLSQSSAKNHIITISGAPLQVQGAAALVKSTLESATTDHQHFVPTDQSFHNMYEPMHSPHPFATPFNSHSLFSSDQHHRQHRNHEQGQLHQEQGSHMPLSQNQVFPVQLFPQAISPPPAAQQQDHRSSARLPPWL